MNIALWSVQILLTLMFLFHGRRMLFPPATLPTGMTYIAAIPALFRRLLG
jgi:hypothetical protein